MVETKDAPAAIGPYSQAVEVECTRMFFCSGQIPLDPADGSIIGGNAAEQTKRVMDNIKAILAQGGYDFSDVVKTTIYLTDLAFFTEVNGVYQAYFHGTFPARSTVQVSALPRGAAVEIEVVACR